MDLWQAVTRLKERPLALGMVAILCLALFALGWTQTKDSYTVSNAQALRFEPKAGGTEQVSSYDSGVIATMVAQNTTSALTSRGGGTVTATNTIVNPPMALPLISITATADSAGDATALLQAAEQENSSFLKTITDTKSGTYRLIETVQSPVPQASSQPRIRAAGAGLILGLLFGTLALIILDTVLRRREAARASDDHFPTDEGARHEHDDARV